jgi:hypothetical protein
MQSSGIAPGLCFEFTAPFGPDVRDAALDLPKPFAMLRLSMMVIPRAYHACRTPSYPVCTSFGMRFRT